MTFDWMNHTALQIVKGIGKTPGDTGSAEINPVIVNLMGGQITLQDFTPNIPAVKNSGVWAESPITDGRQLLAAPVGNVTEKISVLIKGSSANETLGVLSSLNQMVTDCRNYWQSYVQIDPVFLKWQVQCGAGPQYALLYDIELAPTFLSSDNPSIRVDISLEREPYWRPLPPGANPKQWTYEGVLKQTFNSSVATLVSGVHLVTSTIKNFLSWTDRATPSNLNYIDVPAASIAGDAPALVMMSVQSADFINYYAGVSTKPITVGTSTSQRCLDFNACDAALGTDATTAADTGAPSQFSTGTALRGSVSYATATDQRRFQWRGNNLSQPTISDSITRGRYAALLRCRQNGGALADIKMYLKYGFSTSLSPGQTTEVSPTLQAGAGNTTAWPITYMGIIECPIYDRASVDDTGLGLYRDTTSKDYMIELWSRRTAGVGVLYVADLFLLPIDEYAAQMIMNDGSLSSIATLDNTGYYGHGDTRDILTIGGINNFNELRGTAFMLDPAQNNRIHILGYDASGVSIIQSGNSTTVRLNIIPRWSGIRTE